MITRLDTGTLNEVIHGTTNAKKAPPSPSEKKAENMADRRSLQTKSGFVDTTTTQQREPADTKSNAWQKLMNLLIQLRKVCNQYPPLTPWYHLT